MSVISMGLVVVCSCGRNYTRDTWEKLVFVGIQYDGEQTFELRNCSCGSTRALELNGIAEIVALVNECAKSLRALSEKVLENAGENAKDSMDPPARLRAPPVCSERCQVKEKNEQCRLLIGHRCECLFFGEPLSLLQALSWRQEVRLAVDAERENNARLADQFSAWCRSGAVRLADFWAMSSQQERFAAIAERIARKIRGES
jgi:hypothetical protein